MLVIFPVMGPIFLPMARRRNQKPLCHWSRGLRLHMAKVTVLIGMVGFTFTLKGDPYERGFQHGYLVVLE